MNARHAVRDQVAGLPNRLLDPHLELRPTIVASILQRIDKVSR